MNKKDDMVQSATLGAVLRAQGISRRGFLKFAAATGSMLALAPALWPTLAAALEKAQRRSVIWLSFQECTGCSESLTRSHAPTLEGLIFDTLSLDYHHTLQAASGEAAEDARKQAMQDNWGKYLVVVDGSIPMGNPGYSTIAGISNVQTLMETVAGAAAVIAVGTCAAYGGIPMAKPNPTGAVSVADLVKDKPIVNVPGCPPIPVVITGVLSHFLAFDTLPDLDDLGRPLAFFGQSIHDRCYRRPFYDQGKFAKSFDDEGARKGWCLFEVGCKGPTTHNACATAKWNGGVSFPIQSGHGCLGCSEPNFWDAGSFYTSLSMPASPLQYTAAVALTGAALGGVASLANRSKKAGSRAAHQTITVTDLEKPS